MLFRSTGSTYPLLRKVLTSFGTKVAFEDTLDQSLNTLFGGDSGADTPDSSNDSGSGSTTGGSGSNGGSTGGSSSGTADNAALQKALNDARQALADRQKAYASNDLVAAAQADKKLQAAVSAAVAAGG